MTDNNHNALLYKNEDLLQVTFSKFLNLNSSLSIENALDAFLTNFKFFKYRIQRDSSLASTVINQAIAAL